MYILYNIISQTFRRLCNSFMYNCKLINNGSVLHNIRVRKKILLKISTTLCRIEISKKTHFPIKHKNVVSFKYGYNMSI